MAQWRVGSFNTQELTNTAWAFAQASQLDTQLFTVLARVTEQRVCNLNGDPHVTLRALPRCGSMIHAWSLLEHAQRNGSAASLHCFEALLMECEWGVGYEHEIALLKGLEGAAVNVGEQRGCGADEANGVKLLNSQWEISVNHEARNSTFASIWSVCGGLALAPQSHSHKQFDHAAARHYSMGGRAGACKISFEEAGAREHGRGACY